MDSGVPARDPSDGRHSPDAAPRRAGSGRPGDLAAPFDRDLDADEETGDRRRARAPADGLRVTAARRVDRSIPPHVSPRIATRPRPTRRILSPLTKLTPLTGMTVGTLPAQAAAAATPPSTGKKATAAKTGRWTVPIATWLTPSELPFDVEQVRRGAPSTLAGLARTHAHRARVPMRVPCTGSCAGVPCRPAAATLRCAHDACGHRHPRPTLC